MTFGLLATAAAEEGAASSNVGSYAIGALVVALIGFGIAYFLVGPGKREGAKRMGDIPLAMRPYHSDEELETTALERAMSWGVALSMFAAIFLPLYWLVEPARINDKMEEFYNEETEAGRALFVSNCATCHGTNAEGGAAPNPYNADAPWPAPRLNNIAARYEDSEIVGDVREFIAQTLFQGRPGTPMPAWGTAYQGPMNDAQIYSITDYLLSVQTGEVPPIDAQAFVGASGEDLYTNNCARCHGEQLQGIVGPSLWNLYERYGADPGDDEGYAAVQDLIRGTLVNGRYIPTGAIMPSFRNDLDEDAMQSIVEYLESQQMTGGPPFGQIGGYPGTGGANDGSVGTTDAAADSEG